MGFVFCGVSKLSSGVILCGWEWQQMQLSLDHRQLCKTFKDTHHGAHTCRLFIAGVGVFIKSMFLYEECWSSMRGGWHRKIEKHEVQPTSLVYCLYSAFGSPVGLPFLNMCSQMYPSIQGELMSIEILHRTEKCIL